MTHSHACCRHLLRRRRGCVTSSNLGAGPAVLLPRRLCLNGDHPPPLDQFDAASPQVRLQVGGGLRPPRVVEGLAAAVGRPDYSLAQQHQMMCQHDAQQSQSLFIIDPIGPSFGVWRNHYTVTSTAERAVLARTKKYCCVLEHGSSTASATEQHVATGQATPNTATCAYASRHAERACWWNKISLS